jgi:hypothetical protein
MADAIENNEDKTLPDLVLDESLEFVTMIYPTNPPVAVQLNVLQVEKMLAIIGDYRSVMEPEVVAEHVPQQNVSAISSPIWQIESDPLSGNTLLRLRDPRFGWLQYLISNGEAEKLAQHLQSEASTLPPANSERVRIISDSSPIR